jgi:hypothetical protein
MREATESIADRWRRLGIPEQMILALVQQVEGYRRKHAIQRVRLMQPADDITADAKMRGLPRITYDGLLMALKAARR